MTAMDYSAEAAHLQELERITLDHDRTSRKIATAAARYQLDQAVSLAILADSIEALVAHVVGQAPPVLLGDDEAPDEPTWTLATEAAVGDLVAVHDEDDGGPIKGEPYYTVTEVGTSEGNSWVRLGDEMKRWAKDFVIVDRSGSTVDDADEELAERIEADQERDEVDDDWADDGTDLTRLQNAPAPTDGLAALKAGKKAKKKS